MPVEHATIYDVATKAGVSISTVSHTLNRPHRVNPTTRQRVLDAIVDLAVVGFDDGDLAEALDLTTIRQPLEESGRLGFRHLREAIDGRAGSAPGMSRSV